MDHFPLPFTDIILDHVSGREYYSFLDGFSGYNQVVIRKEDQLKTTFTMEWGTFAFNRMTEPATELASVANSEAVEQAVVETPIEEAVELEVVQAADSIFEVVPRNCEGAIQ